jgi:DNA invertase Pin-like site-specific DNA recombinase
MEKAWAFYRRSTDKQELSISDQRRECQAYAQRLGWIIVREFEPVKGWGSGLTIDQDPSFQQMVREAEAGGHGVRYLLVYDVSRFGRLQPEDKIYWERRFKKQGGIQIIYAKDDFKNDGSIGDILTKVVKHSEAHQFSMKLSETTLRGAKSHAMLGHSAGGKAPYGYDRLLVDAQGNPVKVLRRGEHKADKMQRVVWTPSPTEKPIVQSIFETYDKGTGLRLISDDLNHRKVPPPRGRFWSKTILHYILRNCAYLGERIYNKRSYKGYRRGEKGSLFNPKDQWIVKEQAHKPLIDLELFDRVQSKAKVRATHPRGTYHRPYLLTGLAVCQNCGYKLIGWPKKGNGRTYLTYTCSGYTRIGAAACRSFNVLTEDLDRNAVDAIRRRFSHPSWKDEMKPILAAMIEEQFGAGAETQIRDLQQRLEEVNRQINNLLEAAKMGQFSKALMDTLQGLEGQRESIRQEMAEAESKLGAEDDMDSLLEKAVALAEDFARVWGQSLTNEERKEILRKFIHQVTVQHSPERISATYWLYKIPQLPEIQTPATRAFQPLIAGVNCGGRI